MRRLWGALGALVVLTASGCSGDGSHAGDRSAEPPTRTGEVVRVDACDLVGRRAVRRALGQPVRVVGRELDPPTLPTQSCLWGREFGVALVEVQVFVGRAARPRGGHDAHRPGPDTNFRANLSPRVYERVAPVPAEAWSQNNHAGDLLIFLDDPLVEVTAPPGEGFSSPAVATTRGEIRLAQELVRTLG